MTDKTIRSILDNLADTMAQIYPYWNYTDKEPQKEIDEAELEIFKILVEDIEELKIKEDPTAKAHDKHCLVWDWTQGVSIELPNVIIGVFNNRIDNLIKKWTKRT